MEERGETFLYMVAGDVMQIVNGFCHFRYEVSTYIIPIQPFFFFFLSSYSTNFSIQISDNII